MRILNQILRTSPDRSTPAVWRTALEVGAIHALVDGACGAMLYTEVSAGRMAPPALLGYILWYNLLAFGAQAVLGWAVDRGQGYRLTGAAGPWLIAGGILLAAPAPWTAMVLAGLGNACFHVGAAGALLPRCGGRARELGLFVGPGAMGLAAGVWVGCQAVPWRAGAVILLVAGGFRLARGLPGEPVPAPASVRVCPALCLAAGALLASVVIRAAAGGLLSGAWRASAAMGLALGAAACAGKCLGGFAADRYGWRSSATVALAAAAPLLMGGLQSITPALVAMLLVQSTMAVTLAGVYRAMPNRPGLAFGLPSLALLLGSLPGFAPGPIGPPDLARRLAIPAILLSAVFLCHGLRRPSGMAGAGEVKDAEPAPGAPSPAPFRTLKRLAPEVTEPLGTLWRNP